MFDVNFILAIATLLLVAVTWITDYKQWRSIDNIKSFLGGSRNIGEQLGDWLLAKEKLEDGTEITNLESCAKVIGHQIAGSFSMGLKGIASGEVRTVRSIEKKIMENLEDPNIKRLLDYCDEIGVPRELAGLTYDILEKRGKLPDILKNNGQGGTSDHWQI